MRRWWIGGLAVVALGCGGDPKEGVNPGECSDGADNDADGYFDCNDIDCAFSPDCADDDTDPGKNTSDTDPDRDTDDPKDTQPPDGLDIAPHLKAFSIRFWAHMQITGGLGPSLCQGPSPLIKECDCVAVWEGDGVLIESESIRNTYDGHWELVHSDCDDLDAGGTNYTDATWVPDDQLSYHTFRFEWDSRAGAVGGITEWIVHDNIDKNVASENPLRDRQFFVLPNNATGFDDVALEISYREVNKTPQGPGTDFTNTSVTQIRFSEDATPPGLDGFEIPTE